jgi:predicted ATPase/DNA-binding CsgD family transcriptional regulator/tetratricopeptide (TPR) repeat protein
METLVKGTTGAELTAFVGRARELAALLRLVPTTRALTLFGAGGIGKSRLALRLLANLAPGFADGAWFVELADLHQPDLVPARIAAVLGVVEEPGRPQLATLADAIRHRELLIVLDNCEHLIDACAQVCQQLLASAPGLRVITTSREPLRVAAESVWPVPPLSVPGPAADPLTVAASDAITLFADRAAAVKPGFSIRPANVEAVVAICRALDGLPLAIELAAAWVRALSVEQIASRLADRFNLLSSIERSAPPRHRTLRAAIDWSYDLLGPEEKILLRRLSVFAGWPLEMAEQVCADDALPVGHVVDLLTALADKSLVIAEYGEHSAEARYRMLDTVREYAAGRLAEAGETERFHARFRDYAVTEVERLTLIGMAQVKASWPERVASFRRFETETPNLRQILGRCVADGHTEAGLRICAGMRPVWIVQGSFAEGSGWLDALLGVGTQHVPGRVVGAALVSRAQLALASDPAFARDRALAGLALCREPGSDFWAGSALNLLAEEALHAGDPAKAMAWTEEALAVARRAGDRWNEGYALGTQAAVAGYGGDLDRARSLAGRALAIMREVDQLWGAARALLGLGDLARVTGDADAAQAHYQEALSILRELNARPEIARCLAGLGRLAMSQDDLALAGQHLGASLELSQSVGSRIGVIRGLEAFAKLAAARGDDDLAVKLATAAGALREAADLPGRTERAAPGDGGPALSADEAVALALSLGRTRPTDARTRPPDMDGAGPLTARELQVAELVRAGATNRAIADGLRIRQPTAARHVANIMRKLGFNTRAQIAVWVAEKATANVKDRETAR